MHYGRSREWREVNQDPKRASSFACSIDAVNNFARTAGRPDLQRSANSIQASLIRAGESTKLPALGHASSTGEKPAINGRCVRW